VVDFKISKDDLPRLAVQFFKRTVGILSKEGVEYDKAVVAELINKHVPDWRRVLNELQRYSVNGKIDSGIFVNLADENLKTLIGYIKAKNFGEMRKWIGENSDTDSTQLFRKFYDQAYNYVKPASIPELVVLIAKYQYQAAFVADPEINLAAFLTEVMVSLEFL
jgi:DNA polymerase III delta prime subunit